MSHVKLGSCWEPYNLRMKLQIAIWTCHYHLKLIEGALEQLQLHVMCESSINKLFHSDYNIDGYVYTLMHFVTCNYNLTNYKTFYVDGLKENNTGRAFIAFSNFFCFNEA
jgi:hypothetical protein